MKRSKEVDAYITGVPDKFREPLGRMRDKIFELLPDGEETFSYRIPVYRYLGKPIFSIAAFKNHYSLVTQDKEIAEKIPELKNYQISGTSVHFNKQNPVSDNLLEKIIKVRVSSRKRIS